MDQIFEVEAHDSEVLCIEYSPSYNGTLHANLTLYPVIAVPSLRAAADGDGQSGSVDPHLHCQWELRPCSDPR